MATFNTRFDIDDTVVANGSNAVVKSITIGSDRTPYYLVEIAIEVEGSTTYSTVTLPENALSEPVTPEV